VSSTVATGSRRRRFDYPSVIVGSEAFRLILASDSSDTRNSVDDISAATLPDFSGVSWTASSSIVIVGCGWCFVC
jgi:hypothetical protein